MGVSKYFYKINFYYSCQGNYYGSQCEVDGEVVTVAVGASVAAIIIIGLTLVCLVMWSRKWNREQKAAAAAVGGLGGLGSPVFGYMAAGTGGTVKTPAVGPPPYQLTLEDRMRWAHLADVMAQANHYAVSILFLLNNSIFKIKFKMKNVNFLCGT